MCYIFTEEHVNPKFAERACEWFQDTGGPLLKYRFKKYTFVCHARFGPPYGLIDPDVDPDPKVTWAEFAQDREEDVLETLGEFCEEGYFPDPDDEVDSETLLNFHDYTMTPSDSVYFKFQGFVDKISQWSDRDYRELDQEPLGYFRMIDGWGPGLDYRGVVVSSLVALACLQHSLDRVRARVRIELKP